MVKPKGNRVTATPGSAKKAPVRREPEVAENESDGAQQDQDWTTIQQDQDMTTAQHNDGATPSSSEGEDPYDNSGPAEQVGRRAIPLPQRAITSESLKQGVGRKWF